MRARAGKLHAASLRVPARPLAHRRLRAGVLAGGMLVWTGMAGTFLPACSTDGESPAIDPPTGRVPQQVMQQMGLRQTSERGLLWVLEAQEARLYADNEPMDLEGLTIRFYDGQPTVQSVLTSRYGQVHRKEQTLAAQDSVIVRTPEGDRLETQYLEWDPQTERVTTPEPFILFTGPDVISGVGIEADPDLRQYIIRKQLRAVVRDVPLDDSGGGSP